jgi:hypothetical protein
MPKFLGDLFQGFGTSWIKDKKRSWLEFHFSEIPTTR